MKTRACLVLALSILTLSFLFFPANAYAYLDPGTGSYLLQLALAALVGALFAVRLFWGRIKSFFQGLLSRGEGEQDDEGE